MDICFVFFVIFNNVSFVSNFMIIGKNVCPASDMIRRFSCSLNNPVFVLCFNVCQQKFLSCRVLPAVSLLALFDLQWFFLKNLNLFRETCNKRTAMTGSAMYVWPNLHAFLQSSKDKTTQTLEYLFQVSWTSQFVFAKSNYMAATMYCSALFCWRRFIATKSTKKPLNTEAQSNRCGMWNPASCRRSVTLGKPGWEDCLQHESS